MAAADPASAPPASPQALFRAVADAGSLRCFGAEIEPGNPSDWPGYEGQLRAARDSTGARHAVTTGRAAVGGEPCVLIGFEFGFFGGSLGVAEGARIVRAFTVATSERLPVVSVAASGGSRMQEGTSALVQMQAIAAAIGAARRAGIPHIAVAGDPTTGGVWASLVASADVLIGVPGARVSFSGSRTRPAGADPESPDYHAEGKWARGFADVLSPPHRLRAAVAAIILMLSPRSRGATPDRVPVPAWPAAADRGADPGARPADPGARPDPQPAGAAPGPQPDPDPHPVTAGAGPAPHPATAGPDDAGPAPDPATAAPDPHQAGPAPHPATARPDGADPAPHPGDPGEDSWAQVSRARGPQRARADRWLAGYFDQAFEIRGDRCGGVDTGLRCGFGRHDGTTIAYVAQTGQPTTAAGFRTATRLLALAARLGLGVLTLIDTPGAAAAPADEAAGVGPAIAELLIAAGSSPVPVTSVVVGEGVSGGALALASPTDLWMAHDGYLAVTVPELAASILKLPSGDVPQVAARLRLTPAELLSQGIIRGIVRPPAAAPG
jgi:acyl-CoA carboxylase subunit beta